MTCVLVWSKSDQRQLRKTLHKQTNKQTDRHYENNGHLAVNQKHPLKGRDLNDDFCEAIRSLHDSKLHWLSMFYDWLCAWERLQLQPRHGCLSKGKMCQNSLPSGGGRSLGAMISGGRVVPLPICWHHSKGNWLHYNSAADIFYIMKLCSRRFVLYCLNCPKDDKFMYLSPFWGSQGRRRTFVDGSLESRCRVLVMSNWTSFSISCGWGATRQNVSKLAAFRKG